VADKTEVERTRAMTADGRRVGRLHGKRHAEVLANGEARRALSRAISAEGVIRRDAWGSGYVEGLRDALSEPDDKASLGRLEWAD
jgi:hypothetical protein